VSFRDPTTLGRTGLRVGRLGIGAGYGVPAGAVERAYREYGVNYFYWSLRKRSGMTQAIRSLAPAERDKLVIAMQTYDHTGWFMRRYHEKGLRTLGLDYADVLILGWFNSYPKPRVIDAALELRERGLVRHLAMSGHHRPAHGEVARRTDSPIEILMVRYNAAHRGAEQDIFPHLPEANPPGVTTYTATRWGQLLAAKKMPQGEAPLSATDCYRFALSDPHVDLCMIGPKNDHEMNEALITLDAGPLSEDEMTRVRRLGDQVHG
jgi:aryl-alcohol dehydrogenase-like predicted oxidoreductase